MKKITELTDEQRARMPEWADKWIEIGLRTGDADFDRFERAIKVAYEKTQVPFPNNIIRVKSPLVGALASSIAMRILGSSAVGLEVDSAMYSVVASEVGSEVGSAAGLEVESAMDLAVRSEVDSAVYSEVYSEVGSVVALEVESAAASALQTPLKWHGWLGGQFWVDGWWGSPAYVSFFTDVCGLELSPDIQERAQAYRDICESVNYVWPNKNFVMVCDRPVFIKRDEQGRLHSESGHAIEYKDGWGISSWHGITVPDEWMHGTLTPEIALNWDNAEQRRAACEILGWDKVLEHPRGLEEGCRLTTIDNW